MPTLTGTFQSSFIPGRLTTNNIVTIQEIVHSLRTRKGKQGGMVMKLDLEKAYDRVSWQFREHIPCVTGFKSNFRQLILAITTLSTLHVCWTGAVLEGFRPSRGLWQGNQLSPYLFILFMEVLGHSIVRAVELNVWAPIRLTRSGQPLSHLLFSDDLLLFGVVLFSQARVMDHVVRTFCEISGQRVNKEKSRIWFSTHTPSYLRHTICSGLHMKGTSNLGMYLGVPVLHG